MTGEEYIKSLSGEAFLKAVLGQGKCNRCSNCYWDGTQAKCHKNINESSCELGVKEYLESDITENLQRKYKKKRLTNVSYEDWLKEEICEHRNCEWCSNKPSDEKEKVCRTYVYTHEAAQLKHNPLIDKEKNNKFNNLIKEVYNRTKEGNLVGVIFNADYTYELSDIRDIDEFVENKNLDMLYLKSKRTGIEVDVYRWRLEDYEIKTSEHTIFVKLKNKAEIGIMY